MGPPVDAVFARADHSRDPDLDRNPLTYRDPTGEEAIRYLVNGGGPFQITAENGFRLFANRQALEHMLLGMQARVSRGGKLWIDPIPPEKKTTPVVNDANHSHHEGSTEKTTT